MRLIAATVLAALACTGAVLFWGWPSLQVRLEGAGSPPDPVEDVRSPGAPSWRNGAPDPVAFQRITPTPFREPEESRPAEVQPSLGSIQLLASWAEDKQAAAGVPARIIPRGAARPAMHQLERTSDQGGVIEFTRLKPGVYLAETPFGGEPVEIEVEAGRLASRSIVIPAGATVDGIVVDDSGAPVGGANIWLGYGMSDESGAIVARSKPDGTFRLRSTSCRPSKHVAARAPGFIPSPSVILIASPGAVVKARLTLGGAGGAIHGTVVDEKDRPVAGALATLRQERRYLTLGGGAFAAAPVSIEARTDERGEFRLEGVPAGSQLLAVMAPGRAPWKGPVEAAPKTTTEVRVRIAPAVTLGGTARDGSGAPVADAEIRAGAWNDPLASTVRSAADGAYRVEDLPAGELEVHASKRGVGMSSATLAAAEGASLQWNPVLDAGLSLTVKVVDARGVPLPDWSVDLQAAANGGWDMKSGKTGLDGRFAADRCVDAPYRVALTAPGAAGAPSVRVTDVRPAPSDHVITVPDAALADAFITGALYDVDGKPLGGALVNAHRRADEAGAPQITDQATGRFKLGPRPPGDYTLYLSAPGFGALTMGPHRLASGETWDLGEIRLEGAGTLVLKLSRADGKPVMNPWITCKTGSGASVVPELVANGSTWSGVMVPGRYDLHVDGPDLMPATRPFEIRADETTTLELRLEIGCLVRFQFIDAQGAQPDRLHVRLFDPSAGLVAETDLQRHRAFPIEWSLGLNPGSYRVEAASPDSRSTAVTDVTILNSAGTAEKIGIQLR